MTLLPDGLDDGFVDLAHGLYVVGADVEEVGVAVAGGLDAGGGEVFGVDELVAVAAIADDPDGFVVVDEFVEDGEEAEAAGVHDGGAADDDDVEVGGEVLQELFGGEFGFAVELDGGGDVAVFVDGVAKVGGPEAVGGDEDEGADAGGAGVLGEEAGGVDVGGPEEMLVQLRAVGELGGDVIDGVEAVLGEDALEESGVAEVALNAGEAGEASLRRARGRC